MLSQLVEDNKNVGIFYFFILKLSKTIMKPSMNYTDTSSKRVMHYQPRLRCCRLGWENGNYRFTPTCTWGSVKQLVTTLASNTIIPTDEWNKNFKLVPDKYEQKYTIDLKYYHNQVKQAICYNRSWWTEFGIFSYRVNVCKPIKQNAKTKYMYTFYIPSTKSIYLVCRRYFYWTKQTSLVYLFTPVQLQSNWFSSWMFRLVTDSHVVFFAGDIFIDHRSLPRPDQQRPYNR